LAKHRRLEYRRRMTPLRSSRRRVLVAGALASATALVGPLAGSAGAATGGNPPQRGGAATVSDAFRHTGTNAKQVTARSEATVKSKWRATASRRFLKPGKVTHG
jgi:hypothetical protein